MSIQILAKLHLMNSINKYLGNITLKFLKSQQHLKEAI